MEKSKAFVCFCVDGPSEVYAFQRKFEDLFDSIGGDDINVDFRYAVFQREKHGDLTSLKNVNPANIEKMLYKYYFKQKDLKSGLGWNDLTYIIHIIDMDGAYVGDNAIKEFSSSELALANSLITNDKPKNTLYMGDHISVRPEIDPSKPPSIDRMIYRNKRKRQNIEHLLTLDEITIGKKTVKYALYYFSSNLDHYLYGDANLTGDAKTRQAAAFSRSQVDANSLISFFRDSAFSTAKEYEPSWKEIKKGNASLTRGTNVNLLVEKIIESTIEDWL